MAGLHSGIGAGAYRLCLDRLERFIIANLPTDAAFHIIFDIDYVENTDIAAGDTVVLKSSVIATPAEPGHRFFSGDAARLNTQRPQTPAVEIKENLV